MHLCLTNVSSCRLVFKLDALGWEILGIALPAALAVAADPIASLIDTAFIGHIGKVSSSSSFMARQNSILLYLTI
jgi:Na+-driven multidrug efflux pump